MGIFIVVSCDVDRYLNCVKTIRCFSVYTFSRRMFMSRGNLRSSRTRRYDFALVKRGDSVCRHFHYKDPRLGGSSRKDATWICMWDTRKRGCLTSKYIHQTVHFDDSRQYRNTFSCLFFRIRKLANINIAIIYNITVFKTRYKIYIMLMRY